jgi:hypothetical protein
VHLRFEPTQAMLFDATGRRVRATALAGMPVLV